MACRRVRRVVKGTSDHPVVEEDSLDVIVAGGVFDGPHYIVQSELLFSRIRRQRDLLTLGYSHSARVGPVQVEGEDRVSLEGRFFLAGSGQPPDDGEAD